MRMGAAALLALLAAGPGPAASRKDIVEGNPASLVKVYIYDDLQCGDCQTLRTLLDEKILPRYGTRVAFIHRDFPLGKHDWARAAAMAGRWIYAQDPQLGIVYRREIMAEQEHITPGNLPAWLGEFADRNHLDRKGIVDALTDLRLGTLVDQDHQSGEARGVSRMPTVYVGNQAIVETVVYDDLARLLDVELGH